MAPIRLPIWPGNDAGFDARDAYYDALREYQLPMHSQGKKGALQAFVESDHNATLDQSLGRSLFLGAAEHGWDDIAEIIIVKTSELCISGAGYGFKLLTASYRGDLAYIEQLTPVTFGLPVDSMDSVTEEEYCDTALLVAAAKGHSQIVQFLLQASVDPNAADDAGRTALHYAAQKQYGHLIEIFIDDGAHVNARDDDGWTPLTATTSFKDRMLSGLLIEHGADPDVTAHNGINELCQAAGQGDIEYVKFLLEIGTDPSIRTRSQWTPLHEAVVHEHTEIVRLLIAAGADVSALAAQKFTPLDLVQSHDSDVGQMLVQAGALQTSSALEHSSEDVASVSLAEHTYSMHPIADGNKLFLTFDQPRRSRHMQYGQFIYQPENHGRVYHLSTHLDDDSVEALQICLANGVVEPHEYLDTLFGTWPSRISFSETLLSIQRKEDGYGDLLQEFIIGAGDLGLIEATHRDPWHWRFFRIARPDDELLFRSVPDWAVNTATAATGDRIRFVSSAGKLLARISWLDEVPTIMVEGDVDLAMQHLLVACWLAMLWSATVNSEELIPPEEPISMAEKRESFYR